MGNSDHFELTSAPELRAEHQESDTATFLRSFCYSALQTPVNGVFQLVDNVSGRDYLPAVQFIKAPEEVNLAAQLGSLTATAAHLGLMLKASHKLAGPVNETSISAAAASIGKRSLTAGLTGALYGGVLTPTKSSENFFSARAENAAVGAAGLAGISAFSSFYGDCIGKGVKFADAPFYKGLLVPGSLAGVATAADTSLFSRRDNTVFLPSSRLMPYERLESRQLLRKKN